MNKAVVTLILFLMTVKTIVGLFTPQSVYAAAGSLVCPGGSGDYASYDGIIIPSSGSTGKHSIEFWFRTDTNSQSEKGFVSHGGSPTTDSPGWFWQRNGTTIRFFNGGGYTASGTINFTTNTWHHIYFAVDTENDLVYYGKDGTVTTEAFTGTYSENGAWDTYLCSSYSGYIDGEIDDLRISDSVRHTSSYTPPTAPYEDDANTLALYNFDEVTGSVAGDASGSDFDMTLAGAVTWGDGYYEDLVPTPTPTPTPTPIATASGFLNMPDAIQQENKCSAWYERSSTGDIGSEGNGIWYVKNNQATAISRVDLYGQYNDPSGVGGGGIGFSGQTQVSITDFGLPEAGHAFVDTSGFAFGDIMHAYTDYWIDRVFCTIGGTQYEAVVPFGRSMTNPEWAELQQGSFGLKKTCVDFSLTIPLTRIGLSEDWILTMPNYFCILFNWLLDFWYSIFGIDTSLIATNVSAWQSELNSRAPFAYLTAIAEAQPEIGSPSGIASLDDVEYEYAIPWFYNGEWHSTPFIEGTFSFDAYAEFQDEITTFRSAQEVILWVMAFIHIYIFIITLL